MIRNLKYTLQAQETYYTDITGISFDNGEMRLYPSGLLFLRPGAGADGCSPTVKLPFLGVVGPWNGPIHHKYNLPVTYRAFFVHDVLLRYRKEIGITTKQCHRVFQVEISRTPFILRNVYYHLVDIFGPRD